MFDAQEVCPGVWLGSEDASLCPLAEFQRRRITHVVVCGRGLAMAHPEALTYLHLKELVDLPFANVLQYIPGVVDFLSTRTSDDECVLFHCAQGVSRSATVLAAYLMAKERISHREAIYRLRKARPVVSPNASFVSQLEMWNDMGYTLEGDGQVHIEYRAKYRSKPAGVLMQKTEKKS
eukprot:TRINITY_DN10943_c0_g2_i1.p1 TRINITY_DN10943_c0_g2~~TRINITY_DN10943_c0_g2_i1.p1  ORF type:complete len:178 (+),score=8.56 TRINITY_DN10943_c0_g2_i1:50-583(+)